MTEALSPEALADLERNLNDPMWRLENLYWIITKGDDDTDELIVQFKPNRAQRRLLAKLWHRSLILKARQLGFTTLIAILWLDTALFSKSPVRCGIVAQDREAAEVILRDKVKFAYNRLPDVLRERMPLSKESAQEIMFGHNGASIRVATSYRGGTPHRLHISEFGKICAKHPDKAREVVTGSLPAVPKSGICVIESTAEGQDGKFYEYTQLAIAAQERGVKLTPKDWRFHFYPWWEASEYELPDADITFSEAENKYFTETEGVIRRKLSPAKRAWYVATLRSDFAGEAPLMWQEYPSYPAEAFKVSTEGCYYATQLALARQQGRVPEVLPVESAPVWTFWDIGRGDMTTIWLMQKIGVQHRFVGYYEGSGEELDHYVKELQGRGHVFAKHYLPHEAAYKRIGKTADTNQTIQEMLEELWPGQTFEVVPRVTVLSTGIQATRAAFASCWFDETACRTGLQRLANYKKAWNRAAGCWSSDHVHDDNSHGADAFRQFGQVLKAGEKFQQAYRVTDSGKVEKLVQRWRRGRTSGMAV